MIRFTLLHKLFLVSTLAFTAFSCGKISDGNQKTPDPKEPEPKAPETELILDDDKPETILKEGEGQVSKGGKFIVKLEWLSDAKAERFVKARLTFATPQRTKASSVSAIIFDPQMVSMGHGTSVKDQVISAEANSKHILTVDKVYFIMGGPWEIRVTAEVDGAIDTATINVDIP
jgi:hypothetical protein